MQPPTFGWRVLAAIDTEIGTVSPEDQQHLALVAYLIEGNRVTAAAYRSLNRYQLQAGKTFAATARSKEKWKILRLVVNDVVVQHVHTQKIETIPVEILLKRFNAQKVQEVTVIDELIETVKTILGPALGVFLTGALVAWLIEKLSK